MSISYKITDQLLIIETADNFKASDLNNTFDRIFADPRFKSGLKILVHDLDSKFIPSTQDIETGTKRMESIMKKFDAKMAIVVSSEVNYGMGRMFEALSDSRNMKVKVFRDVENAGEWLKKDKPSQ